MPPTLAIASLSVVCLGATLILFALAGLVRRRIRVLPRRLKGETLRRSDAPATFYIRIFSILLIGIGLIVTGIGLPV